MLVYYREVTLRGIREYIIEGHGWQHVLRDKACILVTSLKVRLYNTHPK
jgi:hypothetical protein